jgi:hypothetical protein
MKLPLILFFGVTLLLSGCCTHPESGYQQEAYNRDLVDGTWTIISLQDLDAGDTNRLRQNEMMRLGTEVDGLSFFDARAHPTPEEKQSAIGLAREVLDYLYAHRKDMDPRQPSLQATMHSLSKILKDPEDVKRLQKLLEYQAEIARMRSEIP